jgi:hypothetical protein
MLLAYNNMDFMVMPFPAVWIKFGFIKALSSYRFSGPGLESRPYQIFWEVGGLERGPLSLVRTIEELLEKKVAAPVYKTKINERGNSLRWSRNTLYP